MLMLCLEWWMFEVGGFLAGVISEAELGAQSIAYELTVIAYMVTFPTVHIIEIVTDCATEIVVCFCLTVPDGILCRGLCPSWERSRSRKNRAGQAVMQSPHRHCM